MGQLCSSEFYSHSPDLPSMVGTACCIQRSIFIFFRNFHKYQKYRACFSPELWPFLEKKYTPGCIVHLGRLTRGDRPKIVLAALSKQMSVDCDWRPHLMVSKPLKFIDEAQLFKQNTNPECFNMADYITICIHPYDHGSSTILDHPLSAHLKKNTVFFTFSAFQE